MDDVLLYAWLRDRVSWPRCHACTRVASKPQKCPLIFISRSKAHFYQRTQTKIAATKWNSYEYFRFHLVVGRVTHGGLSNSEFEWIYMTWKESSSFTVKLDAQNLNLNVNLLLFCKRFADKPMLELYLMLMFRVSENEELFLASKLKWRIARLDRYRFADGISWTWYGTHVLQISKSEVRKLKLLAQFATLVARMATNFKTFTHLAIR